MSAYPLLLQAAPTNLLLGSALGIVVAVVGWLLNRTISAFDNSVKETKEVVVKLSEVMNQMRLEMTDGHRLVDYLEKRVETLEHKKDTLEKSFQQIDKIIDREIIHKRPPS